MTSHIELSPFGLLHEFLFMQKSLIRSVIFGLGVLLLLPTVGISQHSWTRVGEDLKSAIREGTTGPYEVFIMMGDQVDVLAMGASFEAEKLPQAVRTATLIPLLQNKAAATQGPILSILQNASVEESQSVIPFWITNVIYAKLELETLDLLDEEESIAMIDLVPQPEIAGASPMPMSPDQVMGAGGHEASLDIINADKLWALGYTGNGRKALIIDTGTDPTHPALRRSFVGVYEGVANGWYGNEAEPYDCDNHGSHVAGTILGLDRETKDTIGVAPNGLWMASPAIQCSNGPGATAALQWAINPDGDASTTADMPDAINNSWRFLPNSWGCNSATQQAITALEAAGVAVICAAGNDNPDYSVGGPAYANYSLVNAFAVGAISPTSPTLSIAGFSSRGPSICGGTGALEIKPEVVAPGVGIRSAVRGGGYAAFQGTSMASPHVAGAVLLLKEAFPTASGTEIKFALYNTAIDLGDPGEDNTYGNGLIDVEAAYYYLIGEGFSPAPVSRNNDGRVTLDLSTPCGLEHEPEIMIENVGTQPIITARILRTYSDGVTDTLTYSGNIVPGTTETLVADPRTLPSGGRYSVRIDLLSVNGLVDEYFIDNWDEYSFSAFEPLTVEAKQLNVCIGAEGMVEAEILESDPNAVLHWYEVEEGGELLGTGNSLPTGTLTSSKIYYLAPGRSYELGPEPEVTAGGYFDSGTQAEVPFEVLFPCTIESIKVLANSPGDRIIQVRNELGSLIHSKIVQVEVGVTEVPLGFLVEPGSGYKMGLGFGKADLWIQTIPPQELGIDGVLEIRSTQSGQLPYFFNWNVSYELPCPREFAFVTVSPGTLNMDIVAEETSAFEIQLTGSPSNAKRYRWYLEDGIVKEGRNITASYPAIGSYTVGMLATGPANCSDYIEKTIQVNGVTSLSDSEFWQGLTVFPNPADSRLTVSWQGSGEVQAVLYDVTGRKVRDQISLSPLNSQHSWSLSDLPEGVFWVQVVQNGRVSIEKVVKSK